MWRKKSRKYSKEADRGGDAKTDPAPSAPAQRDPDDAEHSDAEHYPAKSTSIGVKLIYVAITAAISLLPLVMVQGALSMRDNYASGIIRQLETGHGGHQVLAGPVMHVPARWADGAPPRNDNNPLAEYQPPPALYITPDDLNLATDLQTSVLEKSLYRVIGYDADVEISARFGSLKNVAERESINTAHPVIYEWDQASLLIYLNNTAAMQVRPQLTIGEHVLALSPGLPEGSAVMRSNGLGAGNLVRGYSTDIGYLIDPDANFEIETKLKFKGATDFTIAPIGKSTELTMSSDFPTAQVRPFVAAPTALLTQSDDGDYRGRWSVAGPYRSGPVSVFSADLNSPLLAKQNFQITFDAGNIRPYAEIRRALTYGFFLMAFSFLTFFVFDAVSKRYLHAAQYFLLGLIQTVFYALLLAIAEFVGFDRGFFFAAAPTIAVTGLAVASILRSAGMGIMALIIFTAYYAVQYILMDMAQYSLLVAAGAAFLAIAATLLATSRLDWGRFAKTR